MLLREFQHTLGVSDDGLDSPPVADDPRIRDNRIDLVRPQLNQRLGIEVARNLARTCPLGLNYFPRYAALRTALLITSQ